MKGTKVARKYCGGCNPTFNRKKIVDEIQDYFGIKTELYNENDIPDVLLIVNGCKSECIDISQYKSEKITILINDKSQIRDVITAMKMILDNK